MFIKLFMFKAAYGDGVEVVFVLFAIVYFLVMFRYVMYV